MRRQVQQAHAATLTDRPTAEESPMLSQHSMSTSLSQLTSETHHLHVATPTACQQTPQLLMCSAAALQQQQKTLKYPDAKAFLTYVRWRQTVHFKQLDNPKVGICMRRQRIQPCCHCLMLCLSYLFQTCLGARHAMDCQCLTHFVTLCSSLHNLVNSSLQYSATDVFVYAVLSNAANHMRWTCQCALAGNIDQHLR